MGLPLRVSLLGFSDTAAGGKRGGVGQRHTDLVLNRDQSSG